jgi:hypothetical protein
MEEKTLFKLARAITDTDTVSSKGGTITYRITSLKRKLVNGKVVSTSTPSCTLGSASVTSMDTPENHYMLSLTALSSNQTGANRSGHIFLTCGDANLSIPVTQKPQVASTFTLSGLPTGTGYYLFGRGAKPQNTSSSDQMYVQGLSATGTAIMEIPFYANDSEPGSRIECTTGDIVAVYTKSGATWISEGSFIVPSAGGTVSI